MHHLQHTSYQWPDCDYKATLYANQALLDWLGELQYKALYSVTWFLKPWVCFEIEIYLSIHYLSYLERQKEFIQENTKYDIILANLAAYIINHY